MRIIDNAHEDTESAVQVATGSVCIQVAAGEFAGAGVIIFARLESSLPWEKVASHYRSGLVWYDLPVNSEYYASLTGTTTKTKAVTVVAISE